MAKFLYKSIPEYSKEILDIITDTRIENGVPVNVRTLEEYLDNIDTLTFESIREYIKSILDFNVIDKISHEYLPYLSYLLGHVWNPEINVDYQKYILKSIIQLYKRKGTEFHIHYNLSYFDKNIQIYEPYKDIFILNKSLLNSNKRFTSPDYYSWGIYTIKSVFNPHVVKEIINTTRPAGWRAVFEHVNNWSESFEPRVEDDLWNKIQTTPWYNDIYVRDLHNYIMWGSLYNYNGALLHEDPTGYFVRDTGKNINIPKEFILNAFNNVSSTKRIFTNITKGIDISNFGDKGVYLGPSILYNSQFTVADLGSETLLWPKEEKLNRLFLGSTIAKIADINTVIGNADRTDGGSLFKNAINYNYNDWAKVGPILCDVENAYQIGDRKWLEYDRLEVPYKNTFSVYMGLKPILWSSTAAPLNSYEEPFDSYGKYKFDQRDLDYYFFIHRAFSPKKYSRSIEYACKLVDGLLPSDERLFLSNYEDLPDTGTLVFNNEFIEYKKIIDYTNWAKFYIDDIEYKQAKKSIFSRNIEILFNVNNIDHSFIIDKKLDNTLNFIFYKNNTLLKENIDYKIISKSATNFKIDYIKNNIQILFTMPDLIPSNWKLRMPIVEKEFTYKILTMEENIDFAIEENLYNIKINKFSNNTTLLELIKNSNSQFDILFNFNTSIFKVSSNNITYNIPFDQICVIDNYKINFDNTDNIVKIQNTNNDEIYSVVFNENVLEKSKLFINNNEIEDLSVNVLSDRLDINFKLDEKSRTIYGASDKHGVFQVFYFEGKNRLTKNVDFTAELLTKTIIINDNILNKKILVKYHNSPSIPIINRFISKLGWGTDKNNSYNYPRNFKPRLLVRNDIIDYKYKLHKLNNMQVDIIRFIYPTMNIYLGWDVFENAENVPDHNSIYKWNGTDWVYISKLDEFNINKEKNYSICRIFHTSAEFLNFDGNILNTNSKVLIFSDETDVYHKKIYLWNGINFVFHDILDNFEIEKEKYYGIKKEFISVDEMRYYTRNDIEIGNHVIIKSPRVNNRRKYIAQLHSNNDIVANRVNVNIDSEEFMGKIIQYPYIEKIDKHISTHIIDKKELKNNKKSISFNLGKSQPLSNAIQTNNIEYSVLGGTNNQHNMALNKSYVMYDNRHRYSIGAPILDVCGKDHIDPQDKFLYSYLIGERKPLGNKVYIKIKAKYTYNFDLGKHSILNRNPETLYCFKINWDLYLAMAPGITSSTRGVTAQLIGRLPINFVSNPKDKNFTSSNIILGKTSNTDVVINSAILKDASLSNVNLVYIRNNRYSANPVVLNLIKYKLGSRAWLGNSYISLIPFKYFALGNIKLSLSNNLYVNKLAINISSFNIITQFVTGNERDKIFKFGTYKYLRKYNNYNNKENKLSLSKNSISETILGGVNDSNNNSLDNKNIIRNSFAQQSRYTITLDLKDTKLGYKHILGNTLAIAITLVKLYLNNVKFSINLQLKTSTEIDIFNYTYLGKILSLYTPMKLAGVLNISNKKEDSKYIITNSKQKLKLLDLGNISNAKIQNSIDLKKYLLYATILNSKKYQLGKNIWLGNSYLSMIPIKRFELGKILVTPNNNIKNSELLLNVNTFNIIIPFITGNEKIKLFKLGNRRYLLLDDNKENKFSLSTNSISESVLGGTDDNKTALNTKIDVRNNFKQYSKYPFSLNVKNTKLGYKHILGNKL